MVTCTASRLPRTLVLVHWLCEIWVGVRSNSVCSSSLHGPCSLLCRCCQVTRPGSTSTSFWTNKVWRSGKHNLVEQRRDDTGQGGIQASYYSGHTVPLDLADSALEVGVDAFLV
jgi:hypothetical protein